MTPLLTLLFGWSCCVYAGYSSWAPPNDIAMTDSARFNINKRWFTIEPRENGVRVWPDATVRYCFENDDAKTRLLYTLEAGIDRWYQNSLPKEQFPWKEVSATECQSDRANVLLIKYNDQGILSTTPGIPPLDANSLSYKGPSMILSDRTDVGMLDVIGNFAHEVGHAWGLLHEHQNPSFWSQPYAASFSQIFTFNCQNLKDYNELRGRITDPEEQDELCTDRAFASEQKFSASEYLPIRGGARGPLIAFASDEDVDWESIMLYPSGAGGIGAASPGNDQRSPILLKRSDGSRIPINLNPSTKDVNAVKLLYSINWPTTRPVLLNEPSNPKSSKFKQIFKRQRCV